MKKITLFIVMSIACSSYSFAAGMPPAIHHCQPQEPIDNISLLYMAIAVVVVLIGWINAVRLGKSIKKGNIEAEHKFTHIAAICVLALFALSTFTHDKGIAGLTCFYIMFASIATFNASDENPASWGEIPDD